MNTPTEPTLPGEQIHDNRVQRVEILISNLLRTGVAVSLLLIVAGTIVSFVMHPAYSYSHTDLDRLTRPDAPMSHPISKMIEGLRDGRGQSIAMLGLILLVATPVLRVAVSVLAFVYQRDRVFVAITALVLCLLLLSFFLGKAEV